MFGALGRFALLLRQPAIAIGAPGDFCQTRGLGLGRLADRGLELVHLGQFGDEPGLEFRPELDEQLLGGLGEILGGPGEMFSAGTGRSRRCQGRSGPGSSRPPASPPALIRSFWRATPACPGGPRRPRATRMPGALELPGLVLAEFGPGEVVLRRGGAGVEPLQLFFEHRLGLLFGGDGVGQFTTFATEVGRGVGQVGLGLAQLRWLEVGEHGIGGECRGGLADGNLAIA